MSPRALPPGLPPEELREHGLQIATRLIAVLRMGRAYPIGNPAFTGQLEQLLDVLAPVLRAEPEARLTHADGDLRLNGADLPARAASARFTEQMAHELRVRGIAGVSFTRGLALPELELFMRYFLPSELYRGPDLERACLAQGIRHAVPLPWEQAGPAVASRTSDAPGTYQRALDACARALHDAQWLIGDGLPRGVASHRYQRIVQPLVDSALAGDALSAGLADLDHAEASRWARALQVAVLAVLVGRALGLPRATLAELGVAALIHAADEPGAGETAGASPPALLRRSRLAPLDPPMLLALSAALPERTPGGEPVAVSPAVEILRLADRYVALASRRENGMPRRSPHDALALALASPAAQAHPALRAALVRAVGAYPPGQIVELDDGSVARVCAANPRDPRAPLLECMTGPDAKRLEAPERGLVVPLPEGRRVTRAVPFARRGAAGDASAA